MSVKCSEIIESMEKLAPSVLAESWDNVGLLLGDKNADITKILFALDCCDGVLDEAVKLGADMIITHHPFIFSSIKRLDYENALTKRIVKAIKNDIAVYSAHTNLDIADGGTNSTLAELLCLRNIKPLYQLDKNRYMGKYGELEKFVSLKKFVDFVKEKLNCKSVTLSGNLSSYVNKVGICTGKGTDKEFMLAAKENGCDVYITGDVGYHDGQFAEDIGLNLIDVSHYDSENIVIPKLCEYITKNFSEVECIISQYDGQTLNII